MSLSDILSNSFVLDIVIRALIVGLLVSLCAALLGVSLVLRRFSMIGDGLSHSGFAIIALTTVLNLADYQIEIAIPIVIVAAFLLLRLSQNGRLKGDAAIAVLSTGAIALGSIIFNFSGSRVTDMCDSLFGSSSIITISDKDMYLSIVIASLVLILFVLFYSRIFAVTFDESFAKATGTRVNLYTALLAMLTAVTVVIGMDMMGAIMVSGLIVFPALSAMRIIKSYKGVVLCSGILAVVLFISGFYISCRFSFQPGPTVVTLHLICFIICSAISSIKKRRKLRLKKEV